ncbi:MAG: hypothetical protein ACJA1R_002710 [Flavobacteriales bacterium]|jgi:hypothetical protein
MFEVLRDALKQLEPLGVEIELAEDWQTRGTPKTCIQC